MTALLACVAQLRAIGVPLARLDPQVATAVEAHMRALEEADDVLRECGIQMASLQAWQEGASQPVGTLLSLRDRIDALRGIVPRPAARSED